MRRLILISLFVILFSFLVVAQEEHDFGETKKLIDSGVSCSNLSGAQLEEIGDYYMEQMHPGEAHEYMDRMMGGEGSENLRQVHINIARRIYCNEDVSVGIMGGNMMGGGMMGNYYYQNPQSNNSYQNNIFGFLFMALILVALILFILWLIKQSQKNNKRR